MKEYFIYKSSYHEFSQKFAPSTLVFLAHLINAKHFNHKNENIFLDPVTFGPHHTLIHNKTNLKLLYITNYSNWTHQFALKEISYILTLINKYNSCEISHDNFRYFMQEANKLRNLPKDHFALIYRQKNNWINFKIFPSHNQVVAYIFHNTIYNPQIYKKKYCYYKDDSENYSRLYLESFSFLRYIKQAIHEYRWYKKSLEKILSEPMTSLHELIIFNDIANKTFYIVYDHHHYGDVDEEENECVFNTEIYDHIFFDKLTKIEHCKIKHDNFIEFEKSLYNKEKSIDAQYAMTYYDQNEQICYKYFSTQNEMYEFSDIILEIWHEKLPPEKLIL